MFYFFSWKRDFGSACFGSSSISSLPRQDGAPSLPSCTLFIYFWLYHRVPECLATLTPLWSNQMFWLLKCQQLCPLPSKTCCRKLERSRERMKWVVGCAGSVPNSCTQWLFSRPCSSLLERFSHEHSFAGAILCYSPLLLWFMAATYYCWPPISYLCGNEIFAVRCVVPKHTLPVI